MRTKLLLLIAILALWRPGEGQAALLFTLDPAAGTGTPGSTIAFSGTLQNTGSDELFLNGDAFTLLGSGLSLDDAKFFANAPLSLAGGAFWTGDLFDIIADPSAALGDYGGSFSILGGLDSFGQDELATQGFQVSLYASDPQVVPEPSSLALLGAGLLGVLALQRKKRAG